MKCFKCGGEFVPKVGLYVFDDDYCGEISVELKNSRECKDCGEVLLSLEDAEIVEKAQAATLEDMLQKKPVAAYISASEAMEILKKKTKQSFYQNRKIKRGFIFQTTFDGRKMYLRESVERFKQRGDGRFRLIPREIILRVPSLVDLESNAVSATFMSQEVVPRKQPVYLNRDKIFNTTCESVAVGTSQESTLNSMFSIGDSVGYRYDSQKEIVANG